LDADMQDVVSLDWLKAYRRQSTNPLILLTGSQADSVTGLKSGADDCLAKPLCMDELEARMHALLRRHRIEEVAPSSPPSRHFLRSGSYRAAVYRSASYRGSTFDDAVMANAIAAAGGEVLATGPLSLNPATGVTMLHGN